MSYRFYLSNKRAEGFRKGRCPKCGKKDHFTYYIDREAANGPSIFNEECGLCDTPGCYHLHPSQYLRDRGIQYSNTSTVVSEIKQKETLYIPKEWVIKFHRQENNLMSWILSLPIDMVDIIRAYEMYYFGSTRDGFAIWWQIDNHMKVRTGKMMLYKPDGHRDREEGKYTFDWLHSKLQRRWKDTNGQWHQPVCNFGDRELVQCLFGLHLINSPINADKKVAIVESEKSAFICSMLMPQYIWMATAGMQGFSYLKVLPLIEDNREMIFFPDIDGYESWQTKAVEILKQSNRAKITISPAVKDHWIPSDGKKADIADILVRRLIQSGRTADDSTPTQADVENQTDEIYKAIGINEGENSALDLLINKFDLILSKYNE